ncbi:hypothetical protein D3C86_1960860 [compost metagenome]
MLAEFLEEFPQRLVLCQQHALAPARLQHIEWLRRPGTGGPQVDPLAAAQRQCRPLQGPHERRAAVYRDPAAIRLLAHTELAGADAE